MLCESTQCTGCQVCATVCPKQAIIMKPDPLGFLYPHIDEESCVGCGLCEKLCHGLRGLRDYGDNPIKDIYAAWLKNKQLRMQSTSGGAFTALADAVLEDGGYVVGAAYCEDFSVAHRIVANKQDLQALRGSKYVQSNIHQVLLAIKELVLSGKTVLFSGTPCQVAALNRYIGEERKNLLTIDLVCHGVGSPVIFEKYLDYLEKKYGSSVEQYKFRDKTNSWRFPSAVAQLADGQTYVESGLIDPMFVGFNRDIFQRECCFQCQYTSMQRVSDITLSDFWGYIPESPEFDDADYGVSMIMVNTQKGNSLFQKVRSSIISIPQNEESARRGQPCLYKPTKMSDKRQQLLQDVDKDFEILSKKYFTPRYEMSCYYYYKANHSRELAQKYAPLFRVIDGISRRLKLKKYIIRLIARRR